MDISIPTFVKDLFKQEINNIKIKLVEKIAEEYDLDEEELKEKYICDIKMISKSLENVQITKSKILTPRNRRLSARLRVCFACAQNAHGVRFVLVVTFDVGNDREWPRNFEWPFESH